MSPLVWINALAISIFNLLRGPMRHSSGRDSSRAGGCVGRVL